MALFNRTPLLIGLVLCALAQFSSTDAQDAMCWKPVVPMAGIPVDAGAAACKCVQAACVAKGEESEAGDLSARYEEEATCWDFLQSSGQCDVAHQRRMLASSSENAEDHALVSELLDSTLQEILLSPAKYEAAIRLLITQIVDNQHDNPTLNQFLVGLGSLSNVIIQEVMKDPTLISTLMDSF